MESLIDKQFNYIKYIFDIVYSSFYMILIR